MKIRDLYDIAVKKGMETDPRSRLEISRELNVVRKEYGKLKGVERKAFDRDRLKNPYSDTRVLYGDLDRRIKTVMVGIDMEGPEILLAAWMNERRNEPIDLVMAHHPEGVAWSSLYRVMHLQVAGLKRFGISSEAAERMLKDRSEEVQRSLAPANHSRSVDMARLLDIPFMCVHTPADNHVNDYLQKIFDRKKPRKLSEVISILLNIPEFADGVRKNAGPRVLIGEATKKAGKIFVDMTGGTEGPKKIFARLSQAGVSTVVGMHFSEEHYRHAKEEGINLVIAGHIASDALGLNLLLDEVEKKEPLNIIECSGFMRVRR